MAMDRHDKQKEMASVLLSALYADVISPPQIRDGFVLLLESADDLSVDILDAVDVLALFLARAVVDEILPQPSSQGLRKHCQNLLKVSRLFRLLKRVISQPHTMQNFWRGDGVVVHT